MSHQAQRGAPGDEVPSQGPQRQQQSTSSEPPGFASNSGGTERRGVDLANWMSMSSVFDPLTPAEMQQYQYPAMNLNGTRHLSAGRMPPGLGGRYMGHPPIPGSGGTYSLFGPEGFDMPQNSTSPIPVLAPEPQFQQQLQPGTLAHARSHRNPAQAENLRMIVAMAATGMGFAPPNSNEITTVPTPERNPRLSPPLPSSFAISSEDFPALPGTAKEPVRPKTSECFPARPGATKESIQTNTVEDFPALPGTAKERMPPKNSNSGGIKSKNKIVTTVETAGALSDRSMPQNQMGNNFTDHDRAPGNVYLKPERPVARDRFNMNNLIQALRERDRNPDVLGIDLWGLGIDLLSPDKLHTTFRGPLHQGPGQVEDAEVCVPPEYMNVLKTLQDSGHRPSLKDKLTPLAVSKYKDELLFYLFYQFSGDLLQMLAASELYSRDWRYHMEEKIWVTRGSNLYTEKGPNWERGTFYVFDTVSFRKVTKELHLDYSKLEPRPIIPGPQGQAAAHDLPSSAGRR